MYFTQDEEELADLLVRIGLKRNVARVLVYLPIPRRRRRGRSNGAPISASLK